jgi:hypothetical protein
MNIIAVIDIDGTVADTMDRVNEITKKYTTNKSLYIE